jgi:hypothetical protein
MVRNAIIVGLLALLLAQGARGQVVQLPSITTFGSDTTVLVPDRGTMSLGGNSTARAGSNSFSGLPPQRGIGIDRSASGLSVTARIHDMQELDRELLEAAPARAPLGASAPRATRAAGDAALPSVAEIRRQRAASAAPPEREISALVERARAARATGKSSLARTYYDMAARRATGASYEQIVAERRALGQAQGKAAETSRAVSAKR